LLNPLLLSCSYTFLNVHCRKDALFKLYFHKKRSRTKAWRNRITVSNEYSCLIFKRIFQSTTVWLYRCKHPHAIKWQLTLDEMHSIIEICHGFQILWHIHLKLWQKKCPSTSMLVKSNTIVSLFCQNMLKSIRKG